MIIDIIAPGYGGSPEDLAQVTTYLHRLGLQARIPPNLFGEDPLHAQQDSIRFTHLEEALTNTESDAVWCFKGGYGTAKLLPLLRDIPKPAKQKWVVGFSDITALHLFLQQHWGWPTLHAPVLWQLIHGKVAPECGQQVSAYLKSPATQHFSLTPLNAAAQHFQEKANITGGNLALLQTSLGTFWQMQPKGRILLLEEIDESAYRVDRMLHHLAQAGMLEQAQAILLGDFLDHSGAEQQARLDDVVHRFFQHVTKPVLRIARVGHGLLNHPLPLGVMATLTPHTLEVG